MTKILYATSFFICTQVCPLENLCWESVTLGSNIKLYSVYEKKCQSNDLRWQCSTVQPVINKVLNFVDKAVGVYEVSKIDFRVSCLMTWPQWHFFLYDLSLQKRRVNRGQKVATWGGWQQQSAPPFFCCASPPKCAVSLSMHTTKGQGSKGQTRPIRDWWQCHIDSKGKNKNSIVLLYHTKLWDSITIRNWRGLKSHQITSGTQCCQLREGTWCSGAFSKLYWWPKYFHHIHFGLEWIWNCRA